MKRIKEKAVRKLINIGKRRRELIAPVLAALTMFLIAYYSVREFCIQIRKAQFRKRLICFIMIIVMLFTQAGVANVFAVGTNGGADQDTGDRLQVVGFEPLAENVKEQRVLPGTAVEDLVLPETLAVYLLKASAEPAAEPGVEAPKGSGTESTEGSGVESTEELSTEFTEGSGTESTEGSGVESTEESSVESTEGSGVEPTEESSTESTEGSGPELSISPMTGRI